MDKQSKNSKLQVNVIHGAFAHSRTLAYIPTDNLISGRNNRVHEECIGKNSCDYSKEGTI